MDSTSNHNLACQLHEPETSQWIFQSPEWQTWLHGEKRLLWIFGIPGAGKTILASYLIESIKKSCQNTKSGRRIGWAYHYCYHARAHSHEDPGFLGMILCQLCRQLEHLPLELQRTCTNRREEGPTVTELIQCLTIVSQHFEEISIVIDAVDESKSRGDFLALILLLLQRDLLKNIRLLVTSRDEIDIRRAMESEPTGVRISMSNQYVDNDIRNFVHMTLHSDPGFIRWPNNLLSEVEDALSKGAKGMFVLFALLLVPLLSSLPDKLLGFDGHNANCKYYEHSTKPQP